MEEKLLNSADAPAVLSEWAVAEGRAIGVITLSVAKTLNSLTLEMIDLMDPQLRAWAADERIAAIYMRGAGDRAFCAGGDLGSKGDGPFQVDPAHPENAANARTIARR